MPTFLQVSQKMFGLSKKVDKNANEIVKEAARTFAQEVVPATPVLTGAARSHWKAGLNYIPSGFDKGNADPSGSGALSQMLGAINGRRTGQTIYIVNTAPYIDQLNAGRSNQAPAGFIDMAMDRARAIISKAKVTK